MKKLVLVVMGMVCSIVLFGQTNFQRLTMDEAAAKAKAERKMIFVDLYTSWCGPCKMMADKIFPDPELGKYMNEKFVCVKYDAEKEEEGKALAAKYSVTAYPTFLLLNADQALENQIVGGVAKPEEFPLRVEEALKFSVAALSRQYDEGNRNVAFLSHYLGELRRAHMDELAEKVCASFLANASDVDKTSIASWFVFDNEALAPWGSDAFNYILSHFEQFGNTVGEEKVLNKLTETFEAKLIGILQGKEDMKDLKEVVEQMGPFEFNAKQRLEMYVDMCAPLKNIQEGRCTNKDVESLLALCEKAFPMTPGDKLKKFYFQVLGVVEQEGTMAQKERVHKLNEFMLMHTDNEELKWMLENAMTQQK